MFPAETPKKSETINSQVRSSDVRFHQYRNLLEKKESNHNKCDQIVKSLKKCCCKDSESNDDEQDKRLGLLEELKNDNFGLYKIKVNEISKS